MNVNKKEKDIQSEKRSRRNICLSSNSSLNQRKKAVRSLKMQKMKLKSNKGGKINKLISARNLRNIKSSFMKYKANSSRNVSISRKSGQTKSKKTIRFSKPGKGPKK